MPKSKVIVVDTSVVQSAGWETTSDPVSRQCRNVLETILRVCHKIVLSKEGLIEWRKHGSGFARKWLVRMFSRRKALLVGGAPDHELRAKLLSLATSELVRVEIEKDAHLIETALLYDRIVLSRDEEMRQLLTEAASEIRELGPILWANPAIDPEAVVSWLEQGAKQQPGRRLGGHSLRRPLT
jgi:hypothetical protein